MGVGAAREEPEEGGGCASYEAAGQWGVQRKCKIFTMLKAFTGTNVLSAFVSVHTYTWKESLCAHRRTGCMKMEGGGFGVAEGRGARASEFYLYSIIPHAENPEIRFCIIPTPNSTPSPAKTPDPQPRGVSSGPPRPYAPG